MTANQNIPESEILPEIIKTADEGTAPFASLSDMRTFRSWDFSLPTLTRSRRFTSRHNYATDDAFLATIRNHNRGVSYKLLKAVGALETKDNSVVLYGGSLVDIVTKRESEIKDWDMRLIGEEFVGSPTACVDAAKAFVSNVFAWIKEENERIQIRNQERKGTNAAASDEELYNVQAVTTARSKSTVTVVVPGKATADRGHIAETVLQFTFAPYKTLQDLFGRAYPHCTRLAIKDHAVVLDASAKYCLESLCLIFDATGFARSTSTEMRRVYKYFNEKDSTLSCPS